MDTDKILLQQFVTRYPLPAAQVVESLSDEEIAALLATLPTGLSGKLISKMKPYQAANCLRLVESELAVAWLEQLDIADGEAVLRHSEISFRADLLDLMPPKRAAILRQKLEYRADTVGAWMTPSVFALSQETLVSDAIGMVKMEQERINSFIYIVDEADKLLGNLHLTTLFFADQTKQLATIMRTEIPRLFADTPIKSIQNHPAWYEYLAIPVIDSTGKLIGVLEVESAQKSNAEANEELTKDVLETSSALGELYRIGLTGFLQSLSK